MRRRRMLPALLALLATLGGEPSAVADVAYLDIDLGFMVGVPLKGKVQLGELLAVSVGAVVRDRWMIGGRSRLAVTTSSLGGPAKKGTPPSPRYTGSSFAQSASVTIAYLPVLRPRLRVAVGLSGGFGFWGGCLGYDECGGFGALVGAELRLYAPVHRLVSLHATVEALAQLGIPSSGGALFLPTLWLGVGF